MQEKNVVDFLHGEGRLEGAKTTLWVSLNLGKGELTKAVKNKLKLRMVKLTLHYTNPK